LIDDKGFTIGVFEKKCPYLRGGDWIIVEREGEEKQKPSIEQQLHQACSLATDLRTQLDRALAVIKDLEGVNAELLAMVQGDDESQPPQSQQSTGRSPWRFRKGMLPLLVNPFMY
jgi:hypothetical protein